MVAIHFGKFFLMIRVDSNGSIGTAEGRKKYR
jgi:hypothetical protein